MAYKHSPLYTQAKYLLKYPFKYLANTKLLLMYTSNTEIEAIPAYVTITIIISMTLHKSGDCLIKHLYQE